VSKTWVKRLGNFESEMSDYKEWKHGMKLKWKDSQHDASSQQTKHGQATWVTNLETIEGAPRSSGPAPRTKAASWVSNLRDIEKEDGSAVQAHSKVDLRRKIAQARGFVSSQTAVLIHATHMGRHCQGCSDGTSGPCQSLSSKVCWKHVQVDIGVWNCPGGMVECKTAHSSQEHK
jgi:hypothetical protein